MSSTGNLFHQLCTVEQKVYFYFFKRPERYHQEVLSHSFICLPLPYMEGIVLICNIDLYCVIAIFNGHACPILEIQHRIGIRKSLRFCLGQDFVSD